MVRFLIFSFIVILHGAVFGQRSSNELTIQGTVLGYTYDDSKSLFKKEKKIEIEGSLAGVSIVAQTFAGKTIEAVKTNAGGEFELKLPLGAAFMLTYSKNGYGTSAFKLNLEGIPYDYDEQGLVLENIELILNNYESDKPQDNGEYFGELFFDIEQSEFDFKIREFEAKKRLFKKNEDNTSINLMLRSLEKNVGLNELVEVSDNGNNERRERGDGSDNEMVEEVFVSPELEKSKKELNAYQNLEIDLETVNEEGLKGFETRIKAARELLENDRRNAVSELDFLSIEAREKLLLSAEREFENAKAFIATQKEKIASQEKLIYAIVGVVLLLLALSIIAWIAYRNKKKSGALLAEKNKRIADSINYALKIQNSVLLSETEIKKILPNSFVFYEPLDAVSGDFYWFSEVNGKVIAAAVDCTGHGVPGAFMSLIGNSLLNQIVNEKGISSPAEILKELNEGIIASLRQNEAEEAAQDGMDISICCMDFSAQKLTYAGAMHFAYILQGDEFKTLKGSLNTIGGVVRKRRRSQFKEEELSLKKGDRVYLFSDGYMDQFGGANNEKYNIPRFQDLILSLQKVPVKEQRVEFSKAFKSWKGEGPQIDDVLVIGIEA